MDYRKLPNGAQNPAQGINVSRVEVKKPEILTANEISTLLEAARQYEHPWYSIWVAAVHTGMRSGELRALNWEDIDWNNRKIIVSKTFNNRLKKLKPTKAGYWREVPMNEELEGMLKELRATAKGRKTVFPYFSDWERNEAAKVLKTFCMGIGLRPIKFHTLRACFATQLLQAGVPPVVVMKVGGWGDLKTMQIYTRLAGIEIEGATDKLQFLTPREAMGKVVDLYRPKK